MTMLRMLRLLGVTLLLSSFSFWSQSAMAWWNDAWPYRMGVAIDTSATGANLTENNKEVTLLLKLHTGNFEDFFLVKEDLADIRFVGGDDQTPLKHHVEKVDLLNQLIYIWVKVPQLSGGINTERVWMYYGNQTAVSNAEATGSYDVNTGLVYHFNFSEVLPQDSTAYGSHAADYQGIVNEQSLIASGLSFEAGSPLTIGDQPALAIDPVKGMTVSMWVKTVESQQNAVLLEHTDGANTLQLKIDGSNVFAEYSTPSTTYGTPATAAIIAEQWQHIAVILSADMMSLVVNGNPVSSTPIALEPFTGQWTLGASSQNTNSFIGEVDELRIDTVARNNDWIKAAVASQGISNNLLKPQPAEQLGSGGGSGLFTVLITSVEESGWTVIILLAIMALLSWAVMVGKMLYIRRVSKDDINFLEAYRALGNGDPALLNHEETEEDQELENSPITQAVFGSHDHFQSSPIYRLYHRGIEEVESRMGKTLSARASNLSPQAVDAIKAALDAQMMREIQRLNSKMVLLTIAISGGPFLGLLGTVLGVMITFAAIALTGDVNISAIAPGVAAALLTTVAGLIVAIPALFGYNYLATQVKSSIADMRVFLDEFVTRLAEHYGA